MAFANEQNESLTLPWANFANCSTRSPSLFPFCSSFSHRHRSSKLKHEKNKPWHNSLGLYECRFKWILLARGNSLASDMSLTFSATEPISIFNFGWSNLFLWRKVHHHSPCYTKKIKREQHHLPKVRFPNSWLFGFQHQFSNSKHYTVVSHTLGQFCSFTLSRWKQQHGLLLAARLSHFRPVRRSFNSIRFCASGLGWVLGFFTWNGSSRCQTDWDGEGGS